MQADDPLVHVEVVDVEPDGLGDPRARRVEQLQQRPIAQSDRAVADATREELLDLVGGEGAGQPQRLSGRGDITGDVVGDQPVTRGEAVQPTDAASARVTDDAASGGSASRIATTNAETSAVRTSARSRSPRWSR